MSGDVARGMAAFALLVVVMLSVATFEGARFREHDVPWTTTSLALAPQEGTLEEGATHDAALAVEGPNVAAVVFRLLWQDDVGAGDAFSLRVAGPQGQNGTAGPDGAGELVVRIEVAQPPARLLGPNAAGARHLAAMLVDPVTGAGAWTASVTLDAAPGAALALGGVETQPDGSNPWRLETTVETYAVRAD
ncbi:MAG TPA: hypothetical protein VM582_01585 [Candidatus Thermoplasmatota archaeon]|nr:hypothetical protein [Candidatus Thermoplasmatota archaeon]